MVALGALVPMEAFAENQFPFETTPEGFTTFLNQRNKQMHHYRPHNCKYDTYEGAPAYRGRFITYSCKMDYDIFSSLGKKTCINYVFNYTLGLAGDAKTSLTWDGRYSNGECSKWEKVSATPEPQPAPTPPTQEPSQPQTSPSFADDAGFTKTQVLVGGVSLLSLGVAIGGAVVLISRKKD